MAAGSARLARAQAMLTGETYSCSQRNDRKAIVARRSSLRSLPATSSKTERSFNHGPFGETTAAAAPLHGRIALEAPTAEPPGLQAQACSVLCALCRCRPEVQSPDLTSSKHREVQLTRSAALARDAGKRLRRAADPSVGRAPARPRGQKETKLKSAPHTSHSSLATHTRSGPRPRGRGARRRSWSLVSLPRGGRASLFLSLSSL